jgi:glycine cleavage system T protein
MLERCSHANSPWNLSFSYPRLAGSSAAAVIIAGARPAGKALQPGREVEKINNMPEHSPLHDVTAGGGARFVEDAGWLMPADYGDAGAEYRQTRAAAGLFDLSHRGKIELTGRDAAKFLHNLCTNDVLRLAPGTGCEAFFCTAKAKTVAHALVEHLASPDNQDVFRLDVAPGQAERLLKHLDYYLISEQVEIADRTRDLAELHLAGPQAASVLERVAGEPLPPLNELQHLARPLGEAACHLRRHSPLGLPGYDLLCPREQAAAVWQRLVAAGLRPAGLGTYEVLRVEAGTPVYGKDIDENRFAAEVNRTAQAICYTKGCYLGQEPIVMARDRGHVNRFLMGLKLPGDGPVSPGARVFGAGAEVGQVTSAVASPWLGAVIALAYLRRGSHEPGMEVEVESGGGRLPARVTALPFTS